ncbi:MAG TPA: lipocalin-like domain-containing protein [Anaerolineales bacterium]|nr:lipocalin-like domain-containing protein [Anaerolineales bacterium]
MLNINSETTMMAENLLVGTWRLVACNAYRRNGQIVPIYGENPEGRLFYDAAGNMSVHLMRAGRPNFRDPYKFRATDEEMRAAYQGYEAYFSTYEVDAGRCLIHHTVLGGLFPNWTGSIQSRYFRFDGPDRLTLSTEPADKPPSRRTVVVLIWERLS